MLYVCATPIGNLSDVTLRVLDTLRSVELIAAEDTRRTRKLLSHFDIHTPLTSLFAHNEAQKTAYVLGVLREGRDVALVTDAGTPGVSDPGARLIAAALTERLALTVLPGPSAVVTALAASGFAADTGFRFVSYLPRRATALRAAAGSWVASGGVVVAFETPRRLGRSLAELAALAPAAEGAVCRELTKLHEEVARGTLAELAGRFAEGVRGEVTLVLDFGGLQRAAGTMPSAAQRRPGRRGAPGAIGASSAEGRGVVTTLEEASAVAASLVAKGLSRRDAATALAVCLDLPRNEAYRLVEGRSRTP
jgi:16S rRNA (cytidine1402-2'-O)-methyltransferase